MRRTIFRLTLILTLVLGVGQFAGGGLVAPTHAQDATPPPLRQGISLTILGNGLPSAAPDHVLYLIRGMFEPGGWIAPHYHPGAQIFYVDQGTIGFTVYKGPLRLVRAGTATPTADPGSAGEMVPPGTEVLLQPGDWLYYEADVVESARNAGDVPAVFLLSTLYQAGQPLAIFTNPEGTPIPAPPVH
jgi:quercetin dioxygenase-like cupin family protein